jgi:hypothetical protein
MNLYMLMSPNNTVQPPQFVPNFVTGILFMNKADHTTFFGTNLEYIQGIHMIPLTAISPFIRQPAFVAAEWQAKLASMINNVNSGWKGILMANLAISNPQAAWNFFTVGFKGSQWLDDGASLTWYLSFIAGILAGGPPQPTPQPPQPAPQPPQPTPQPPQPTPQPPQPTPQPPQPTPQPPQPTPQPPQPTPQPTPGPVPAAPWDPTKFYAVGAIVSYQGHTYQCDIAHQAEATWAPDVAVSLWKEIS